MKAHKLVDALSGIDPINLVYNYAGEESIPGRLLPQLKDDVLRAQKFELGNGHVFNDSSLIMTGEQGLSDGLLRLPFPVCYFEYDIPEYHETYGVLALEFDDPKYFIAIHPFLYKGSGEITGWFDLGVSVFANPLCGSGGDWYQVQPLMDKDQYISMDNACGVSHSAAVTVVASLAVINAQGVTLENIAAPDKLNRSRKKRGVTPLFEYNIVRIGSSSNYHKHLESGERRSPPRLHWRRGHTRTLSTGSKTFVRAALVGDASAGVIDKHYIR
jgi:hypothetical protein